MSVAAATPAGLDQRLLRSALGSFATGVIIVTAAYEGGEHGMTANSFTSVSLSPPLVLFCTHNNARMTRLIERGTELGLSVLARDQANVSSHFAGKPQGGVEVEFSWWRGVPVIAGATAHFICRMLDSRIAGDHTVHIAEVEDCAPLHEPPLLFFRGAYAQLARDIDTRAAATVSA